MWTYKHTNIYIQTLRHESRNANREKKEREPNKGEKSGLGMWGFFMFFFFWVNPYKPFNFHDKHLSTEKNHRFKRFLWQVMKYSKHVYTYMLFICLNRYPF